MKQNILVFNLNGRGGMLHYSSQFSNALAKIANIRVLVPSYTDTSLYEGHIELWKIRTNPTLGSFILDSLNIFAHIGLLWKILRFSPEIIHILDNHPWYIPYALIGKILGIKIYVTQHDPFPHSGEKKGIFHEVAIWVNRFLRKYSDLLMVHEEFMKEKVSKEYGIDIKKIRSIPHGAYDFLERNTKISRDPKTFLFFGRIVAYKGLEVLLKAMELLKNEYHEPFTLIIAGDGNISPYIDAIEKSKESIELTNRFISDVEIRDFFSRASFVVLPYHDATASGIIPLAYSFSLPVIATNVGVLGNYVEDGTTGMLIEKNNPESLKEAILHLLRNPELSETLGRAGYQFQKQHLTWEAIVKKIYTP